MTTENEEVFNLQNTNELLSDLYKNVTMAQNAIKALLPYVEDKTLTKELHKEVEEYDHYIEKVGTLAKEINFDPTPATKFALTMSSCALRWKMIADKSTTHVAKIMLQGTLNGIIDLYRLKKTEGAKEESVQLLKKILTYEETTLEKLKEWL